MNMDQMGKQRVTPELMNISPFSVHDTPDGEHSNSSAVDDLLRNEWLLARKSQLQAQLDMIKSDNNTAIDQLPADDLNERYGKLKDELLDRTVVKDSQELILRGEQLATTARNALNTDQVGYGDAIAVQQKRLLEEILAELTEVSSDVGKEHNALTLLRTDLEELKKHNFELFKRSRQLYQEIADKKKSREEEMRILTTASGGKRLQEALQVKLQRNLIQCNILQGLIHGSGVNWAQDPALQALLLQAGKPVHL